MTPLSGAGRKHRYKNIMHCEDCFDKGFKKIKHEVQPTRMLVSPHRKKMLDKYGDTFEGWTKNV